jgi:hypothetical protein
MTLQNQYPLQFDEDLKKWPNISLVRNSCHKFHSLDGATMLLLKWSNFAYEPH